MPRDLPVPDATGIYGFPVDLIRAHEQRQRDLAASRQHDLVELVAPATGQGFLIQRRAPQGDRVTIAIEPHNDDFVLSAGGTFLAHPRPLVVITAYSQSSDIHPLAQVPDTSTAAVSRLRAKETAEALRAFGAAHHSLGYQDAHKPFEMTDRVRIDEITESLSDAISAIAPGGNYELIAPASVTRHPDHLAIHEAAVRLGCKMFWDDTAFYPTYAASFDDRHLFELRFQNKTTTRYVDITEYVLDKLTLLYMYQSQMQPPLEMYRAIRYNWTVASVANSPGTTQAGIYAERFFDANQLAAA